MPTEKTQKRPLAKGRRQFILGAGAGAAAVGAALIAKAPGTPDTAAAAGSKPDQKDGYKLTEHISNYYRTARV